MTTGKCYRFNGENDQDPYHYTECGLDDVYLYSGFVYEPKEETVRVREAEELHKVIGVHLATETKVLTGKELRFLRKEMCLTQAELGHLIGLGAQTVARWEKDQHDIGGPEDALVRLLYLEHAGMPPKSVKKLLDNLDKRDAGRNEAHVFEQQDGDWKYRKAA